MNPNQPRPQTIGSNVNTVTLELWTGGHPLWTRIRIGQEETGLREEEARLLHYHLGRIIAHIDYLEHQRIVDSNRSAA